MGLRTLFLGLAIAGLYLFIRRLWRQRQTRRGHPARKTRAVESVQCARCGLHLPREDALRKGEHYYCSRAHLQGTDEDASS